MNKTQENEIDRATINRILAVYENAPLDGRVYWKNLAQALALVVVLFVIFAFGSGTISGGTLAYDPFGGLVVVVIVCVPYLIHKLASRLSKNTDYYNEIHGLIKKYGQQ